MTRDMVIHYCESTLIRSPLGARETVLTANDRRIWKITVVQEILYDFLSGWGSELHDIGTHVHH